MQISVILSHLRAIEIHLKKTLLKPIQGKGLRRVSIYKGVHREYFFYIFISRHRINTKCDRKTTVFLYRLQDSVQISVSFKLKPAEKRALFCIKFLTIRPNLQKFDQIFNHGNLTTNASN